MSELTALAPDQMAPHLLIAASYLGRYSNDMTRLGYGRDLKIYFDWCERNGMSPLVVRRWNVQLFVRYLESERSYTPCGIQRTMVAVRGFYKTAVHDDVLGKNPCNGVVEPRVVDDPTSRPFLTRHQLADLLAAAKEASPTDWAMVHLMATIGMRVTAVCDVEVKDLKRGDDGMRLLRSVGKNRKVMLYGLPPIVNEAIELARAGRKSGIIFRSGRGNEMNRRMVGHRVELLGKKAGIPHHVHPHMLRRSHITLALAAGIPMRTVQLSVAHSDIRTTSSYDSIGILPSQQSSHQVASILAAASY